VTTQVIAPVLSNLGSLTGRRLLDVACGTGHLVAAAARRGASPEGIDFAAPMIGAARNNYPHRIFRVADATELPYDDASFDAVTCAFGLSHMANPQGAVDEAFRVLKPGGRFAFTLWFDADRGSELFAVIRSAIQCHATAKVVLPETWTALRFADETICEALVRRAGFRPPEFQILPVIWQSKEAQDLIEFVNKLTLRTAMTINGQPDAVRARIYAQIRRDAEARRRGGVISLAWPALLTVAQKPA